MELKYERPAKWQKLTQENMVLKNNDLKVIRNYLLRIIMDIAQSAEVSDSFKNKQIKEIRALSLNLEYPRRISKALSIKIKKLLIIFEVIEHNETKFYDLYEGAFHDIMFNEKMMYLFTLLNLNFEEDQRGEELTRYKFNNKNVNIQVEIQDLLFNNLNK